MSIISAHITKQVKALRSATSQLEAICNDFVALEIDHNEFVLVLSAEAPVSRATIGRYNGLSLKEGMEIPVQECMPRIRLSYLALVVPEIGEKGLTQVGYKLQKGEDFVGLTWDGGKISCVKDLYPWVVMYDRLKNSFSKRTIFHGDEAVAALDMLSGGITLKQYEELFKPRQ